MGPLRTPWLRSLAASLAVVLCSASPRDAAACTCVDTTVVPVSAADLLANHAAIFEGRVVGAPDPPEPAPDAGYQERLADLEARVERLKSEMGDREVHFDALRSWKGAAGQIVVRTRGQRTACGYPFTVGRTYVVFAYRGEDGALWANSCGRTRPSEEAEADRALLNAHRSGPTMTSAAPPRAGCAGCSVTPRGDGGALVGLALACLAVSRRRRR